MTRVIPVLQILQILCFLPNLSIMDLQHRRLDLFKIIGYEKSNLSRIIAATAVVLSISCTKEIEALDNLDLSDSYTWPAPPGSVPSNKNLSVRVVEFGSGEEITNARLNFIQPSYITGLNGSVMNSWYTDSFGEVRLMPGQFPALDGYIHYYYEVDKDGYWQNGGIAMDNGNPADLFEADTVISTVNADSIVVSLFPLSWLRIHLRTVNKYDSSVGLVLYDHILKYTGYIGKYYNNIENGLILPHAGQIDTTFTIMTKGNVKNELMIALSGTNGAPITETRYVAKGDTVNWELQF
jgi:hypothetical protein